MRSLPQTISALAILSVLTLNLGCSGHRDMKLLTDRAELALAAEIYNVENDGARITLSYTESISAEKIRFENPDVIIGKNLSSIDVTYLLRRMKYVYPVYETLQDSQEGRTHLIPLSFELPLIMGRSETMSKLPDPILVRADELREASRAFSVLSKDGRLLRLAFSPSWNQDFLLDVLATKNPEPFSIDMESIDEESINQTVMDIRDWIIEGAGDIESDIQFSNRYRYIPDEVSVLNGRILFARTDFEYWNSLPDVINRELDIRYFGGKRSIPVVSVVRAGIPKRAKSVRAAEDFIEWLMLPSTQSQLMKSWESAGITVFGFLGGLSSLQEVNQTVMAQHFPRIKTPESQFFLAPRYLPIRWARTRGEVIIPWLETAIKSPRTELSLLDAYREWDLSVFSETE